MLTLAVMASSRARPTAMISRGRTEKPVTGFKGRSGRPFKAKLALMQAEDGKWRVEFDEPWAREGAKPPEGEEPVAQKQQQPDRAPGTGQAAA